MLTMCVAFGMTTLSELGHFSSIRSATGVGHHMNMEKPDEFNQVVLDFLDLQGRIRRGVLSISNKTVLIKTVLIHSNLTFVCTLWRWAKFTELMAYASYS